MANITKTLIFLISVICITSSISSGQLITGGVLGGVLTCTNASISTARTFPVISQTRVDLVCGNGSLARVIQSAITSTAGVYSFVFTTLDTVLNDPGSCYLRVQLPIASCNLNASNGILRTPIAVLRVVDLVAGRWLILIPGALSYVLGV